MALVKKIQIEKRVKKKFRSITKSVLVTGATVLIGSSLVEELINKENDETTVSYQN